MRRPVKALVIAAALAVAPFASAASAAAPGPCAIIYTPPEVSITGIPLRPAAYGVSCARGRYQLAMLCRFISTSPVRPAPAPRWVFGPVVDAPGTSTARCGRDGYPDPSTIGAVDA